MRVEGPYSAKVCATTFDSPAARAASTSCRSALVALPARSSEVADGGGLDPQDVRGRVVQRANLFGVDALWR
jgi:hypothetical protein